MKINKIFTAFMMCLVGVMCFISNENKVSASSRFRYGIYTLDDYYAFVETVNNGNDYSGNEVILMRDLNFNNSEVVPMEYFNGYFNGNSHKITNVRINDSDGTNVGFIKHLGENGVIDNLCMRGYGSRLAYQAFVKGGENVGAFVGFNEGLVRNCTNYGVNVWAKGENAGGIVGYNLGEIRKCSIADFTMISKNCDLLMETIIPASKQVETIEKTYYSGKKVKTTIVTSESSKIETEYGESGELFAGYNVGLVNMCQIFKENT